MHLYPGFNDVLASLNLRVHMNINVFTGTKLQSEGPWTEMQIEIETYSSNNIRWIETLEMHTCLCSLVKWVFSHCFLNQNSRIWCLGPSCWAAGLPGVQPPTCDWLEITGRTPRLQPPNDENQRDNEVFFFFFWLAVSIDEDNVNETNCTVDPQLWSKLWSVEMINMDVKYGVQAQPVWMREWWKW